MIITTKSYPRAALVGNPSDGYHGKTIAFAFTNFRAQVTLYHTPEIEIVPNTRDHFNFKSMENLIRDVDRYGYYGGVRLLKATVKKFAEYCKQNGIVLDNRNFTIRYNSDIPHGLGLGGSSAIITACMRSLMAFFAIDIPKPVLANLVHGVETEELGISAGLQDRVAQVYQGLVFMDFAEEIMEQQGYGKYEYLDETSLPELYIAFKTDLAEGSEKVHGVYRSKYKNRDESFQAAIDRWIELTDEVYERLSKGTHPEIGESLDENFDLRLTVQTINEGNIQMVEAARKAGATAKFTGSGGAIIGTYPDEQALQGLKSSLAQIGVEVIKPVIAERYK